MEDAYFLASNLAGKGWIFGGVYDGHRGSYAAEYASKNIYRRFLGSFLRIHSPEKAFIRSYERVSKELSNQVSGTCAANFFIKDGKIYYANAGDARIILVQKRQALQLTAVHRANMKFERDRIEMMGGKIEDGYVWSGQLGLQPTRTLGDEDFKRAGVIAAPSVGFHEITKDDLFLIAGTDGLFDVMGKSSIWDLMMMKGLNDANEVARLLKEEVLKNPKARDNLTVIVLSLKQFWP